MPDAFGGLSKALVNADQSNSAGVEKTDPHSISRLVQARERKRIFAIVAMTILFWLIAATGILVLAYGHFCLYLPREIAIVTQPSLLNEPGYIGSEEGLQWLGRVGFNVATATVTALVLASLCTVWLVSVTRRATLRHVDANLAAICQQLKQLQEVLAERH